MNYCPCGSRRDYLECCGLLIENQIHAATPEILMRSRYTAYTLAKIDYIKKTMQGKPLENFDEIEAVSWARQLTWRGLEVIRTFIDEKDKDLGYVEFIASFEQQNCKQTIHELSQFQYLDGQWFYTDRIESVIRPTKKVIPARNAPCPCGSQKKYKNCHGINS
ncbi:MAG: YchJ family protein [Tatlockia sp.]|nr:YchJ family protein [Tatlockia sp.]